MFVATGDRLPVLCVELLERPAAELPAEPPADQRPNRHPEPRAERAGHHAEPGSAVGRDDTRRDRQEEITGQHRDLDQRHHGWRRRWIEPAGDDSIEPCAEQQEGDERNEHCHEDEDEEQAGGASHGGQSLGIAEAQS